jgi:YbbR domain-containing protein
MPFQDIDEVSSSEMPRPPSGINRILRRVFIEDWNLKLLSLAITLVLWFIVTGQNTPVNTHASVQLKFIRPNSLEISNEPPKSVDVLLAGSKYRLDDLNKTALVATIDISDQRAGERVLRLADRAQLDLPQGVTVEAFQPSAISVRLEPIVQRQLEVEAKLEGTLADGYEVYSVRPSKSTVAVVGPASNVNAVSKAKTETISIAGRRETFTAPNVAIDISDPKIDLPDPVVTIDVEIGERRIEKTLSDIQVKTQSGGAVQPATATIVIYGPPNILADLKPNDIKLLLPASGEVSGATLEIPAAARDKVILRSVKPSKFTPQVNINRSR